MVCGIVVVAVVCSLYVESVRLCCVCGVCMVCVWYVLRCLWRGVCCVWCVLSIYVESVRVCGA